MNGLEIRDLEKSFQGKKILDGLSFQLSRGEILAVLGPSGSGKTTLLKIIAGLEEPDGGDCLWDGNSLKGIPTHLRDFGLMFQEYVLFPHKDVGENVAFGLKMAGLSPQDSSIQVGEILDLVGLPGFEDRNISTLSGGEQQRVALARSLAPEPRLVMLDEPLGALDRTIRDRLIGELRDILKKACQTALYVTHDQEEAFVIADRVVILGDGTAAQIGTPREIYNQPNSAYVAKFLGLTNLVEASAQVKGSGSILTTGIGQWNLNKKVAGKGTLLLRPDRISLIPGNLEDPAMLTGELVAISFSGSMTQITLQIEDQQLDFYIQDSEGDPLRLGEELKLWFSPQEAIEFFPESS
jgi:ABC-type Fe3+/spermidine/putrescine transport system ATPase subunit